MSFDSRGWVTLLGLASLTGFVLTGCSTVVDDLDGGTPETLTPVVEAPVSPLSIPEVTIGVIDSEHGVLVVDKYTLYVTDHDERAPTAPSCRKACALRWPPVLVSDERPVPRSGVDASDLGVVTRQDGSKQVTLRGQPLYRYSGDSAPGQVEGDGAGRGTWHRATPTR